MNTKSEQAMCKDVSPREAMARLTEFHVLDVRARNEYCGKLAHIPGAQLLPLDDLTQRNPSLAFERPVLTVCRSGRRSRAACAWLRERGVEVYNLEGGMMQWRELELPVERCPEYMKWVQS